MQFADDIDFKTLFVFKKNWIENMNWALLPKASKSILPVILSHCDGNGLSFPSERRIAILSGRTDKIVRAGIRGLEAFPGFKVSYYTSKRGKRAKRYKMTMPVIKPGETFPFHRCIIYGGNWCQLTSTAAALYLVMRYFGFFDIDMYDEDDDLIEFDEIYKNRDYDFCEADSNILAEFAGISQRSIKAALDTLTANSLIEEIENGLWKVFLIPPKHFKRQFLNKQIMGRYSYENRGGKKYR